MSMQKVLALDIESQNLSLFQNYRWSITYSYDGKKATTILNPDGVRKKDLPKQFIKDLADEKILKVIHNASFDGVQLLHCYGLVIRNIWDTMQCEVVIQGISLAKMKKKTLNEYEEKLLELHGIALEDVLPRYKLGKLDKSVRENFINRPPGIPFTKIEKKYMADDVLPLIPLQQMQEYILRRDDLLDVALLENKYVEKRIRAKAKGIGFNPEVWRQIAIANTKEFERRISKLPYEVENWNSEKQVKSYFRRAFNVNIPCYKSKDPKVDDLDSIYLKLRAGTYYPNKADNKSQLAVRACETLGSFIYARELHKSVSSYGLNWFEPDKDGRLYVDPDGRIRPDVTQIKETGRTSMANPNLQQLPGHGRKDYEHEVVMQILYRGDARNKPQHRRAFIPEPGCAFDLGDFGGQEIGIMAAASEEKLWIDAMLRGDDVHALTASLLYQQEWDQGTSKGCTFPKKCQCPGHLTPRERAKILNFMLAYGGGPTRFSKNTGLDMLESRITVARYRKIIPNLTRYLERNARNAVNTGESYSADPYRRRRVLRGEQKWQIENQGKNNPIQAAGANMLKLAAISLPDKYYSPLEIHDEIILEVDLSEAVKAAEVLRTVMQKSADYVTGIKGLIKAEPRIQMNLMKDLKKVPKITGIKTGEFCYAPK
jgi:hypothetical protein